MVQAGLETSLESTFLMPAKRRIPRPGPPGCGFLGCPGGPEAWSSSCAWDLAERLGRLIFHLVPALRLRPGLAADLPARVHLALHFSARPDLVSSSRQLSADVPWPEK